MKQKKSFFNKFHRKYLFLQNSLSDFLHWRTSNSFEQSDLVSTHLFQTKNGSVLLEQEKICLQEYWKSTENKKIKNAFQNLNNQGAFSSFKLFLKEKKQKKLGYISEFSTKMESNSFLQDSFNNVGAFKKNNGKKISERRTLFLNSSDFNKKSILPRSGSQKLLKKGFHENKKYIIFQKKLRKLKNFKEGNSNF